MVALSVVVAGFDCVRAEGNHKGCPYRSDIPSIPSIHVNSHAPLRFLAALGMTEAGNVRSLCPYGHFPHEWGNSRAPTHPSILSILLIRVQTNTTKNAPLRFAGGRFLVVLVDDRRLALWGYGGVVWEEYPDAFTDFHRVVFA